LDQAAFEIDALAFRRLATSSDAGDLDRAAKLYTGGLLDGLDIDSEEFESWRRAEAARFRDQAADVLNRLMTQLSDAGETDRAIETGRRYLTLDPLHEAGVRRMMRLYAGSGRRSAAISSITLSGGAEGRSRRPARGRDSATLFAKYSVAARADTSSGRRGHQIASLQRDGASEQWVP
jgi:hypothetical protein